MLLEQEKGLSLKFYLFTISAYLKNSPTNSESMFPWWEGLALKVLKSQSTDV